MLQTLVGRVDAQPLEEVAQFGEPLAAEGHVAVPVEEGPQIEEVSLGPDLVPVQARGQASRPLIRRPLR